MSKSPAKKPPVPRNKHGQFVKGVSGNPAGLPKGTKQRLTVLRENTELALRDYLADPAQQVKAMRAIDRIMDIAENSPDEKAAVGAFKVLFDRLLPNVKQADDGPAKTNNNAVPTVLQIVNYTGQPGTPPVRVIDGEVIDGEVEDAPDQ